MPSELAGSYGLAWGLAVLLVAIVAWRRTPEGVVLYAAFADWWLILWLLYTLWAPAGVLWVLFGWTLPTALAWFRMWRRDAEAQ